MNRLIKIFFLVLLLLIPLNLGGFPGINDETSFIDAMRQTQENDVGNPRDASSSYRKASEDKHPWRNGTFLDMELIVWPSLGGDERIEIDPRVKAEYGLGWFAGCSIGSYPVIVGGFNCPNELSPLTSVYNIQMLIIPYIITNISLKGPGKILPGGSYGVIPVKFYGNIGKKTTAVLTVQGKNGYDIGNGIQWYDVQCQHKTLLYPPCSGCECIGTTPTIYDDDADNEIESAGSVNLWVDSGGTACPPYTWSTSSTGWSLNSNKTNNDLETVTLSLINTSGKTCGTDYDVYATVTVTDDCGVTDDIIMIYSGRYYSRNLGCAYDTGGGTCATYDCENIPYLFAVVGGKLYRWSFSEACVNVCGSGWTCYSGNCIDPPNDLLPCDYLNDSQCDCEYDYCHASATTYCYKEIQCP